MIISLHWSFSFFPCVGFWRVARGHFAERTLAGVGRLVYVEHEARIQVMVACTKLKRSWNIYHSTLCRPSYSLTFSNDLANTNNPHGI